MSLEDVDFMIENSDKESAVFFVDSALRNKLYFPHPSEYTVEFSEPVKNVYGIEILDAAMPVSMWNVDNHNNKLAFSQVFTVDGVSNDDFVSWFAELQYNTQFDHLFTGMWSSEIFVFNNKPNFESALASITTVSLSYNCLMLRNAVYKEDHSITLVDNDVTDMGYYVFEWQGKKYKVLVTDALLDVIKGRDGFYIGSDMTFVHYTTAYISDAAVALVIGNNTSPLYDVLISSVWFEIEKGNYDAVSMYNYMRTVMNNVAANKSTHKITPTALLPGLTVKYGQIQKQNVMKWVFEGKYAFFFDMKKSTCEEVLGFSTYAYEHQKDLYKKLHHHNNDQLFMSFTVANPDQFTSVDIPTYQVLVPPGILNMLGARFILLRIPEVEDHMSMSLAYGKYYPGVGLFKLAAGNEVTHLRFDFLNLIRKPFHPIGKLTKLTLRFEMKNNMPYDFKGVDHNLTFVIKYYAPKTVQRGFKSVLNTNYNPNILDFVIKNKMEASSSEDDAEEDDDEEDEEETFNTRRMLLEQKQYTYSSEDDDD